MAKIKDYGLREYPEPQSVFEYFMGSREETIKEKAIARELGSTGSKTYQAVSTLKDLIGINQARIPFTYYFK
jgi:hypothetical protein